MSKRPKIVSTMGLRDYYDECRENCCYPVPRWNDIKAGCICFVILAAIVTVAVVLFCYGFIMHITVTVDQASLTRFSLVTSPVTALAYNLSLTMVINNNNWAMNIKYKHGLEADYSFDGQRFDRVQMIDPGYVQRPMKSNVYHLISGTEGAYVALGNAGIANFKTQNETGVFDVEADLSDQIQYQAHYTWCTLHVSCPLKLELAPAGTNHEVVFQEVRCKVAKPDNKNC